MINSPLTPSRADEVRDADIEAIVESGPRGAIALAGIATFVVVAIWFAFYLFVFTPRAMTPGARTRPPCTIRVASVWPLSSSVAGRQSAS